ncbi:MAG: hypothetical protein AAGU19_03070 [Prolixibacteraceae bacterium]
MKRYVIFVVFFALVELSFAQKPFKYVIIPTQFPELGKGFNPYGVSSSLQKILNEKGFRSVFEADERPADYCDAVSVVLDKTSSMFTNKLMVQLKDCQNNVVWSREGVGRSKDFSEGYAEALADALDNLREMPENRLLANVGVAPAVVPVPEQPAQIPAAVSAPEVIGTEENDEVYKPQNLFFNETYFVDLISEGENRKQLVIINGKLLGYEKLQKIAVLTPSDLPGMYTTEWTTPRGETLRGVARLTDNKLSITLSSEGNPVVITLMKQ